jgi:hypothetical protein
MTARGAACRTSARSPASSKAATRDDLRIAAFGVRTRLLRRIGAGAAAQEQPLVPPQVMHLRQEPLRTIVKLWHSGQASPS